MKILNQLANFTIISTTTVFFYRNGSYKWFNSVKRTEQFGEILAALIALHIAKEAGEKILSMRVDKNIYGLVCLGIENLTIESNSSFMKLTTGNNKRANGVLVDMLGAAVDAIKNIDWV